MNATPTARRVRRAGNDNNDMNSDGTHMNLPSSSAPQLSVPDGPSEGPTEIRAIWGTTVNLAETMKSFREFMLGFKPKYRISYDRERGVRTRTMATPEEGEVLLYEAYLRRMRQTGETNLNLDMVDLAAYPPSRKLQTQLIKYPQEVIPAMDQVLKDLMLEVAEQDQQAGIEGMIGQDGEEEIAEIMSKVYKIRPFGMQSVNMRELNPTGDSCVSLSHIRCADVFASQIRTSLFALRDL
jgi:DNA replication licensing factor MCM4